MNQSNRVAITTLDEVSYPDKVATFGIDG